MEPSGQRSARTPLVIVAGLPAAPVADVAESLRRQRAGTTALVHHNLREVTNGVVHRRLRHGDRDEDTTLELVHGCVSCTLRGNVLPLLSALASKPTVDRIVLHLDPALEPDAACWAIQHVSLGGRTLDEFVAVEAVVTVVDAESWLGDAAGDELLAERGLPASADDERTVAQVAVGQVAFADALVLAGQFEDPWASGRSRAVLDRLAPTAPRVDLERFVPDSLLAQVPQDARRGEIDGPHGPLLRGQPPLESDSGVSLTLFEQRRPFHPDRLHQALDMLLDGVIRVRGRAWVASQPDTVLWLESAGGGLQVEHAGPWLAALSDERWAHMPAQRRARAALSWDDYYGDRAQELVILAHDAKPQDIRRTLDEAVLTDAELATGRQAWAQYPDPFDDWHAEPCGDLIDRPDVPGGNGPAPLSPATDTEAERGNRS